MIDQETCEELISRVRNIFDKLNIKFIENRPEKKTFDGHYAFKKSPKRTYLYIQYCNKVKPSDNSNICFRFLKGYDSKLWFKSGNHPNSLIKWRDSMFKHWSEDQGYHGFVREQARATEQYAFGIESTDFVDKDFDDALRYLISMSVASIERDKLTFDNLIQ